MTGLHYRLTNAEVLDFIEKGLKECEKDVLLYLRTLDPFGDRALELSVRGIARTLKYNPSSISRALKVLDREGYIDLELIKVQVKIRTQATAMHTSNSVALTQQPMHTRNDEGAKATVDASEQQPMHTRNDEGLKPFQDTDSGTSHTIQTLKTLKTHIQDPSHVGELEKLVSEPSEPSSAIESAGTENQNEIPDQAQKGSEMTQGSAAAPPPVENSNHPTAKTEEYCKTQGKSKNQPELPADLKHVWIGPGRLDFLPELLEACSRHLKGYDKPHSTTNAKNYLSNRIQGQEWRAIEIRLQEMAEYARRRQNNSTTVNHAVTPPENFEGNPGTYRAYRADEPKAFVDMSPQEQETYRAAIAAMKAKTAGLGFAHIGEAIAQAAQMEVA